MHGIFVGVLSPKGFSCKATALIGALIISMPPTPAAAQTVDHARIEALFAVLEEEVGAPTTQTASEPQPSPTPGSAPKLNVASVPVPGDIPSLGPMAPTVTSGGTDRANTLFAYALPQGEGCPRSAPEFSAAVDEFEEITADISATVQEIEGEFDALSEDMIKMRAQETFQCSKALTKDIEAMSQALEGFDATDQMAQAENLGTCAQRAATRIGREMNLIPQDAPRAQLVERSSLSRQLDDASRQDGRLTDVMISMASMRNKQLRIREAIEEFREECAFADRDRYGIDASVYE